MNIKNNKFFYWVNKSIELEKTGRLVNLNEIYCDYGKPKYKTPNRFLSYKIIKRDIEYWCERKNYEIEKVIQFKGGNIFVCSQIALLYLRSMDMVNYVEGITLMNKLRRSESIPEEYANIYRMFDLN